MIMATIVIHIHGGRFSQKRTQLIKTGWIKLSVLLSSRIELFLRLIHSQNLRPRLKTYPDDLGQVLINGVIVMWELACYPHSKSSRWIAWASCRPSSPN